MTVIAYIALWILDKGTPMIPFTHMKDDPKAEAIASTGWMIIYSLVFAGALIAPFSLDTFIIREVVWTFVIIMVTSILTLISVRLLSPLMRYCGKDGLDSVGKEPIAIAIFYLGMCILIGIMGYTALTA